MRALRDEADWDIASQAYDAIASRYDRIPLTSRINAHMRRLSVRALIRAFLPGDKVLEVGCGTGEEAVELAQRGIEVVALDPSPVMLEQAREKVEALELESRVTLLQGQARDLSRLDLREHRPFDGGFASFSLAYEPRLERVAVDLHGLVTGRGVFLASLPSRLCAMEFVLSLAALRPFYAGRRLSNWYGHKVGEMWVPIRAYSPSAVARAFQPYFNLEQVLAIPSLLPPPYMDRIYRRAEGLADLLENVDQKLSPRFPFKYVGDHFLAILRRKPRK